VTNPLKVAIYARVSTFEQNPASQLSALRRYAQQRDFVVYKEYIDHISGDAASKSRQTRKRDIAFEALMADAGKRAFDCVLVWKYDRFARSLGVLIQALQHFNSLHIDFISYTQNIDTTTPMGRLFFHIIGSFAEFEREIIVERVRAGLANARAKGKVLGRPERDPTAGDRIAILREQGLSLRDIAKREGMSPAGILKILKRRQNKDNTCQSVS
jgi:DNA invertase Pin-like site-specific DNA recombinase